MNSRESRVSRLGLDFHTNECQYRVICDTGEVIYLHGGCNIRIGTSRVSKTARINQAEADKQTEILRAEGEAQARIRRAEAEAIAIDKITEAVGRSTNPANYLIAQKYIDMLQEVASGDKTKTVYMPYEATNLMGSIGGIKDLFKES